ncbi:MAG: hypothetical protein ABIN91_20820 [Mucilaginibacter sp.]|uniref:hypothetical protein n=1 Tax=Mucilaginibacter sp. TaxID=1882438 RepID=UPI003266D945
MLPEEVYKRRHFGTPQSFFLITVNYVVLALAVQMFAACSHIQTFFWVVIAALAAYNVYKIRRDREEYDKIRIIAYVISVAGMVLLFFAFRINLHC